MLLAFLYREPSDSEMSPLPILTFESSDISRKGDPYKLSGTAQMAEDRSIELKFTIKYSGIRVEYKGDKVEGREMVIGSWISHHDDDPTSPPVTGSFSLLRVSEGVMDLLLSPQVLVWNRARLLWHLAIEFAIRQVKRRTWKALHERRLQRRQFLGLYIKMKGYSLSDGEVDRYRELLNQLTITDTRYYQSLGNDIRRTTPQHL